jgi:hypothetical protein
VTLFFWCPFDIDSDTQTSLFSSGSLLYICKYIGSLHVNEVKRECPQDARVRNSKQGSYRCTCVYTGCQKIGLGEIKRRGI